MTPTSGIGSVPAGTAAPTPVGGAVKRRKVVIRDPKTKKLVTVWMEVGKAQKLAARRAEARSTPAARANPGTPAPPNRAQQDLALIPKPFRSLVDAPGLTRAVDSAIDQQVRPLTAAEEAARRQHQANLDASASINAQTQATLGSALQNVASGTSMMQGQAAQEAAALDGANQAAADKLRGIMSGTANPQLAAMLGNVFGSASTQQNGENVQNVVGVGLGGQLQHDFLQRAQGIAGMSQAAFNNNQTQRLAEVVANIATNIAAVRGQRPDLLRKYAGEEAAFSLEQQKAANESAATNAAFGLDTYRAQTDRMNVVSDAQNDANSNAIRAGQDHTPASERPGQYGNIPAKHDKAITKILDGLAVTAANIGKPIDPKKPNGKKYQWVYGGPWRDGFEALKARTGLSPDTAALLLSSKGYDASFGRSTPKNILKLMKNRGVSDGVAKRIITKWFGPSGWKQAHAAPVRQVATRPGGSITVGTGDGTVVAAV